MATAAEHDAMTRALALAASTSGAPHPNPRVGCVLLDSAGTVLGVGRHDGPGRPHAEVVALRAAGATTPGATAVVTLEPCNHTGLTGPCTEALVAAGVSRVVFAQADPNPLAAGGAAALTASGLEVEGGVRADEAQALNPIWSFAMRQQRPLVTWKYAATVDGRVAAADGSSRWVSGPDSRAQVHRLRRSADAVVVGTGTAITDDPQLTARNEDDVLYHEQPLRVVVGRRDLPTTARVLDPCAETVLLKTHDVQEVLGALFARQVHHALLEGGPTLAAAFLRGATIDRVVGYIGPRLLGAGVSLLAPLDVHTMADAYRLSFDDVGALGDDLSWTGRLRTDAPPLMRKDL